MDYRDNSELRYSYEEDETADTEQGRKWVFRDGAAILGINCVYMLISWFALSGAYRMIFTAAALAGMLFGLILMTRTRHCRKFLIASFVLSALPAVGIMILLFVKNFDLFKIKGEQSLGGWVWFFDVVRKFLKALAVTLARAAVILIYCAVQVFAYIDLFETKAVRAYIKSKNNLHFKIKD